MFMQKRIALLLALVLLTSIIASACKKDPEETSGYVVEPTTGQDDKPSPGGTVVPAIEFMNWRFEEEAERDGYKLVPTHFTDTGICVLSSFLLTILSDETVPSDGTVPDDETAPDDETSPSEEATQSNIGISKITIDGQPDPVIVSEGENTFRVTPSVPLAYNSLCIVRLSRAQGADTTWAFQTIAKLQITGILPRHQATNVPVNTGIEVNFSLDGHTPIDDFFSISPEADGKFITKGNTSVFMPTDPLSYGEIYTVTIKAGIVVEGTYEAITDDLIFSFETEAKPDQTSPHDYTAQIHFFTAYAEYPSFEAPDLGYWLSYDSNNQRPQIEVGIYQFNSANEAVDAVSRLLGVPYWSVVACERSQVDANKLRRIDSFKITNKNDENWAERMTLPKNLPPGFYLVNATVQGRVSQVILQITDIVVQVVADDDKAIVWVNDMSTGKPVRGAEVIDPVSGKSFYTDENGIAIARGNILRGGAALNMLVVRADTRENIVILQGTSGIVPLHFIREEMWWGPQIYPDDDYWSILQLDRTLFKREDKLNFWGFAIDRQTGTAPDNVTAVLTSASWGWYNTDDTPLHRQTVSVKDGSFNGSIDLPHLDPDSYYLTIYYGDITLATTYFEVRDFVKPPYKLTVSADRRAVFAGDTVNFTTRGEFFEGTPVSMLDISYNIWGWQLQNDRSGNGSTDIDGEFSISTGEIMAGAGGQGQTYISFMAEATLPEIGWTAVQESVMVFINDIEVRVGATRTGRNANLSVEVSKITLDRMNDENAANRWDYLDGPGAGQKLSVDIVRIWWEPVRTGESYDFVTRTVKPTYRYDYKEQVIDQFEITTGADGKVSKDFTVPDKDKESYIARVKTTCGFGRSIAHDVFIGRDWSRFYGSAWNNELFLDGARSWDEGYSIGEEVSLTVMRGEEKVTTGNVLFVVANMGILDYKVAANTLEFTFDEKHLPGAMVQAIFFNGHTYSSSWQMTQRINFNRDDRKLDITVSLNRDSYKPGETASLTVTTRDPDGNPKPANVNISIVDEALFALREYYVDTLAELYRPVSTGIVLNHSTHRAFISEGIEDDSAPAASPEAAEDAGGSGSGTDTYIREKFEDTAHFLTVTTNERGEARLSLQLPDNITSWRLTASGVTTDFYSGNSIENIRVSIPMFINYSINNVFLVGDTPHIGLTVYGTDLSGSESVTFTVWDTETPDNKLTAKGAPFERVNIPLWKMTELGAHSIVIHAETSTGLSDAMRHPYHILESHQTVDTSVFYDVTTETQFEAGRPGLTNITFTDSGRGQFLWQLMGMRYVRGERIEGLVARREADRLIRQYFPDLEIYYIDASFDPSMYQQEDGGIAMLPYASSDLELTVAVLPFIGDEINLQAVGGYLKNIFSSSTGENKIIALYGLAQLGAPVMQDLHIYSRAENLTLRDAAYLALGLLAIGEKHRAAELYKEYIVPNIQEIAPYYRIRDDFDFRDTSVVALLAQKLGAPERAGLHLYTKGHERDDLLTKVERLSYISLEIEAVNEADASITYTMFGESFTQDLSSKRHFTLRIPTMNLHEFKITGITGDVGAVSIHSVPLKDVETIDNDITIKRLYFREGSGSPVTSLNEGDLVRVELTIDYTQKSLTGSYQVTDFLPSGLVFVQESARFREQSGINRSRVWATSEGQQVLFFDYNSRFSQVRTYYYYARVINPGSFTAEGPIVQNLDAKEYLTIGAPEVVQISG